MSQTRFGDPETDGKGDYRTFEQKVEDRVEGLAVQAEAKKIFDASQADAKDDEGWRPFVKGGDFWLRKPKGIPALWGSGTDVLWAEGESLMIYGMLGMGKSTLALNLLHAQLFGGWVLDQPVLAVDGRILYLAMDRPAQISRASRQIFTESEYEKLNERVAIWRGPPPGDMSKDIHLLNRMAEKAGADIVYLDSIKDAAIGLSSDEVGAGYNMARQNLIAEGRQLCELHHPIKHGSGAVTDIYGSAWIANGAGSIVELSAKKPGDPIVDFKHKRQPADTVGPFKLLHDQDSGRITVHHAVDLIKAAEAEKDNGGLTASAAAYLLYRSGEPADIEKARRKLNKEEGLVCRKGERGGKGTAWFPADTEASE